MAALKLQFVHIPKSGGMSLNAALAFAFAPAPSYTFYGNEEDAALWHVHFNDDHWQHQHHWLLFCQTFLQSLCLKDYHFIGGHLPFSPLAHAYFKDQWRWVTVLRDPIERYRSHLIHLVLFKGQHPTQAYAVGDADPIPEIEALHAHPQIPYVIGSAMTLALGGLGHHLQPDLPNRLANAKSALHTMAAVGNTRHLDAFAQQLSLILQRPVQLPTLNVTRATLNNPSILNRIHRWFDNQTPAIQDACAPDSQLFHYAIDHHLISP